MTTKPRFALLVLASLLLQLAPASAHAEVHVVQMLDNNPFPAETYIKPGDTVRWVHAESALHRHNVVADDRSWSSGEPGYRWEYERQFDTPGEYRFHCSEHSVPGAQLFIEDNGRVIVETEDDPGPDFQINTAISDAWYDPATDGQGFFIVVWESSQYLFLSWFTFDTVRPPEDTEAELGEPGHRWLTAQGPYEGDTAELDIYLTSGGVFDASEPAAEMPVPYGSIDIQWANCSQGLLSYEIPTVNRAGQIPIQRIVDDNVAACEAAQPGQR